MLSSLRSVSAAYDARLVSATFTLQLLLLSADAGAPHMCLVKCDLHLDETFVVQSNPLFHKDKWQ